MPTVGHVELSGLESEILGALVKGDGRPNKCIAWDVGLSEECVKAHIYRISRKIRPGGGLGRLGVAVWFLKQTGFECNKMEPKLETALGGGHDEPVRAGTPARK